MKKPKRVVLAVGYMAEPVDEGWYLTKDADEESDQVPLDVTAIAVGERIRLIAEILPVRRAAKEAR